MSRLNTAAGVRPQPYHFSFQAIDTSLIKGISEFHYCTCTDKFEKE